MNDITTVAQHNRCPSKAAFLGMIAEAKQVFVFAPAFDRYVMITKKEAVYMADLVHDVALLLRSNGKLFIDSALG